MRRPKGCPMPPAAPKMATFLSGVEELLYARWDAASACWDRRKRPFMTIGFAKS